MSTAMTMDDRDTLPWYRQFWPWFIIFLPASAVVASLYTVSLAVRTTDSLVISAEDGVDVATERNLAAERRAAELGLEAVVAIDLATGAITTSVPNEQIDASATLTLQLSHPTDSTRDLSLDLVAAMPGADGPVWAGHLVSVPEGRWYVILRSGDDWRLTGTWTGESTLALRAQSGR